MITTSAARRRVPPIVPARLTFTLRHVGAGQVVTVRCRCRQNVEVDRLDIVEIHHDVAEVAGEQHARAVRGDLEDFASGAAVEQHRVSAVLTFDGVAAVARIPLEGVVAGTEEQRHRCLAGRR